MAITIEPNVSTGAGLSVDWKGVAQYTQVIHVKGLDGPYHSRMDRAMAAAGLSNLSRVRHPTRKDWYALSATVRPLGSDAAEINVIYGQRQAASGGERKTKRKPLIEVGATLVEKQTNLDVDGNQIVVTYTPSGTTTVKENTGTITALFPQATIEATYETSEHPVIGARKYIGRTNVATWNGEAPGKWLCTRWTGRTQDGGKTWETSVGFQLDLDGWDPQVAFVDPETGEVPTDVTFSNGKKTVTRYRRVRFPF